MLKTKLTRLNLSRYIVCPEKKLSPLKNSLVNVPGLERVEFVDEEERFSCCIKKEALNTYKNSIGHKLTWYFQQLLKLYAGEALGLDDYVVLDSDIVWFAHWKLSNGWGVHPEKGRVGGNEQTHNHSYSSVHVPVYTYARSSQKLSQYEETTKKLLGKHPSSHRFPGRHVCVCVYLFPRPVPPFQYQFIYV